MRHFGTVIAALVIAPVAWLLLSFGQAESLKNAEGRPDTAVVSAHGFLQPLLFLAAAGILLGIIATLRFSPLGAVLAGAAYLGLYALLLADPHRVLDALPKNVSIAGLHADATTPLRTGTAALVGAMMLVAVVSTKRWRRWPDGESGGYWGGGGYEATTVTAKDPWDYSPEREPTTLSSWTSSLRR
jgi:hypothetical protein